MCTVSFIPAGKKVFLTSNRDEKHWRKPAIAPEWYSFNTGKILFPRDPDAGGTWIAGHENGNAIVFLNGAFRAHVKTPPYRMSRGLVLLELLDSASPYDKFNALDLRNIEPFTAVIWDNGQLYECRWDGKEKHPVKLDNSRAHIWSSCTLYEDAVIMKRKQWFINWMEKNTTPGQSEILDFHRFTGDGDSHNDLLMNRNGHEFTVSVTSMEINEGRVSMQYLDLLRNPVKQ